MNKIRVCAFLALVVFIGSVVTDMFSGFMDGWNEAGDQKDRPAQDKALCVTFGAGR